MKKILIGLLLLLPFSSIAEKKDNEALYKSFQTIFEKTQKDYVEEPDGEEMIEAAISWHGFFT
jgi:hypothetical protein